MSDQPQTLPPLPFVCPLCLWSWASEEGLRAHIQPTHNTTLDRFDAVMEEPTNAINYHVGVNERLTAEVERLTRERDNARAWSARWKAVAKRLWGGIHQSLDQSERLAARMLKAEAERDDLAAQVAALLEALEHADEVARLTTWGITVTDCREACEHPACLILRAISRYRKTRAALAAAGGEGQG